MSSIKLLGRTGTLSGFTLDSSLSENASGPNPRPYTKKEIIDLINNIQDNFNPERLEELFLMMERHIHNSDNPHDLTLEDLGTSVLEELYGEWTDRGHTGTIEEFATVLFQFIQIASDEETLEGESETKVVSVRGAKLIYDDHINSEHAHDELFRAMLPGEPLTQYPIYSNQAFIGYSPDINVDRADVQYYHLPTGYLAVMPADTLKPDYLYGHPAYPVFGERTNIATYSQTLEVGSFIGGYKTVWNNGKSILGEYDAVAFIESESAIASKHGYQSESFLFTEGVCYSVSIYAMPIDKDFFSIQLPEALVGSALPIHSLVAKDTHSDPYGYDSDNNDFELNFLPNGWVRVSHVFKAQTTMSANVECLFHDIIDGDLTYVPDGEIAGALYQIQVEVGEGASPPIITLEDEVTRASTTLNVPFMSLFDERQGTLAITTNKPFSVSGDSAKYLYELMSIYGDEGDLVDTNADFSEWTSGDPDDYTITNDDVDNYVEEHVDGLRIVSDNTAALAVSRTFDVITNSTMRFAVGKIGHTAGSVRYAIFDETNSAWIQAATDVASSDQNGTYEIEFDVPETCESITISILRDASGPTDYIITGWSLLRVLAAAKTVLRGYYPSGHDKNLYMESLNKYDTTLSYNLTGNNVKPQTTYVHGYGVTAHAYGNTGDLPTVKSLIDLTLTPAEAGDYILDTIMATHDLSDEQVLLIDFDNMIVPSTISTDELTDSQILDIILATTYTAEKTNSGSNDLVAIDILTEEETSEQLVLQGHADILHIGCDHNGVNHRDGYIFDIVYYTQQSSAMNVEFLTGEYNGE